VTSYSVARRRHEIGIRLALGAQKLAVFSLLVREGVRLVFWSVVGGSLLALCAIHLLRSFAYGVGGSEASIILLVTLLLSSVGVLACCLPAHRAAGEDPLAAIGQR
jgi:ABC-type antimicrobial peptide transport system permease subunit